MSKTLKILISVAFFAAFAYSEANAQNIASFRQKLAEPDSFYGTSVKTVEHGSAADAVNFRPSNKPQYITGYRICIFFDKRQEARQGATEAQELFRIYFPDVLSYMTYENPAWIVNVGNCITKEEALILQNKVAKRFPTAFFWTGEIPVTEFLKMPEPESNQPAE